MITAILVVLLFVFLILYVIVNEAKPQNYPPGPHWWPLLGNGFEVRRLSKKLKGHYLALTELAKKHDTSILGLKLGRDFVVVGSSLSVVRAIFTRDVFTGRPTSFFMKLRCFGRRQGITSVDGYLWKTARAFTVRHLKQFGYGKEAMERLIEDEVRELIQFLKKEEKIDNFSDTTAPSVLNVLWALATGKRLEKSDPRLKKLLKLLNRRAQAFDMAGGALNQMPWLRFIAPDRTGYSLLEELNSELKEFLTDTVNEQRKSYNPNETRSLIDGFLHEKSKNRNDFSYSDDQLIVLLLDLLLGGAQTTSRTLDFAVLLMLKNPEVQEKVHRNIVEVIGRSRLPTQEDKSKLTYVEAVILEVMRIFCVVPVAGPRRCLEDTTLNGFFVPKNTTILLNLYAVHHDETLFPEPFQFRPERFLNSEGQLINQDSVLAFGLGKRRCLGEALAKSFIFSLFVGIMQNFEITSVSQAEEPSLEPLSGLTLAPKPYSAHFCWR